MEDTATMIPHDHEPRALTVEVARLCFSIFAAIEDLVSQDFDLAYILFVLILRTHPETGQEAKTTRPSVGQVNVDSNVAITANIYEIAKFTGMNRATVRRKMFKLAELGLISRIDDERWVLGRVGEGVPDRISRLSMEVKRALDEFAGSRVCKGAPTEATLTIFHDRLKETAISPREARKKISKGAFYVFANHNI